VSNTAGNLQTGVGGWIVTGTGTQFLSTFRVGDTITINGKAREIGYIASNTSMGMANQFVFANTNATYNYSGGSRLIVTTNGYVGVNDSSGLASTFTVRGSACFKTVGGSAACGNDAGNIYYTTANTGNYDVAEKYRTYDTSLSAGDVITLDTAHALSVTVATSSDVSFIGVVSTAPGVLLGGSDGNVSSAIREVPVALSGRVPVKISLGNGAVAVGDRLTVSSTTPGVAVKMIGSGSYFGQALQPYTSANVTASSTIASSTIDAFINPGIYYAGLSITTATSTAAKLAGGGGLNLLLKSMGASVVKGVLNITHLVVNTFTATSAFIEHLTVGGATVGSAAAPSGITLYDTVTKKPYCFSIANGKPTTADGACSSASSVTTTATSSGASSGSSSTSSSNTLGTGTGSTSTTTISTATTTNQTASSTVATSTTSTSTSTGSQATSTTTAATATSTQATSTATVSTTQSTSVSTTTNSTNISASTVSASTVKNTSTAATTTIAATAASASSPQPATKTSTATAAAAATAPVVITTVSTPSAVVSTTTASSN